jgi:hypothetical protein
VDQFLAAEITKIKSQIANKFQIPRLNVQSSEAVLEIDYWTLELVWILALGRL